MKHFIAIAVWALLAVASLARTCGANCPAGNCPWCPCGTSPSMVNPATWCAKFSDWDQACCQCIVKHSSGGNQYAVSYNSDGSFNAGVWMVPQAYWGHCSEGKAPCLPDTNLNCATGIWESSGRSFKAWPAAAVCGCS